MYKYENNNSSISFSIGVRLVINLRTTKIIIIKTATP